jgi:hypothetical protein
MSQEKLHLKIGVSGTYWGKKPQYRIKFNDQVLREDTISSESGTVEYYEFDVDYSEDRVSLEISLLNKDHTDTVENEDKTAIVNDMLLNINSVVIDDINLGQVLFEQSTYCPDHAVVWNGVETKELKRCMNLGWNGTWSLTWSNPFYIWLLENM